MKRFVKEEMPPLGVNLFMPVPVTSRLARHRFIASLSTLQELHQLLRQLSFFGHFRRLEVGDVRK